MSDGPYVNEWNNGARYAFVIAIAIGLYVGYTTEIVNGVFVILILSGAYLAVSFYFKDKKDDSGGPSEFGAAMVGGILVAGIGACGLVYKFTDDVIITVVCVLAVIIVTSAMMAMRYRKYL